MDFMLWVSRHFKSTVQFANAHPAHFWRIVINLSASEAGLFFCNLSNHLEYIAFIMKETSISQMPHHYFCLKIVFNIFSKYYLSQILACTWIYQQKN